MEKKISSIIVYFAILLLLCGCNEKTQKASGEKEITNIFHINENQRYWSNKNIKKVEKGYYYFYGERLYYLNQETMEAMLVCTTPDCKHNDKYCNAYFGLYGDNYEYSFLDIGLEVTDKYIYVIGIEELDVTNFYLYRVSRDGTKREKLFYLYSTEKNYSFYDYIMHRESLYRAVINEKKAYLERTNLEGTVTTIFDLSQYHGVSLDTIQGYKDYIYFYATYYQDKERKKLCSKLYKYNINTHKIEVVLDNFICNEYRLMDENNLIYMDLDYSIKRKNIKTKEEKVIRPTDGNYSEFSYDGNNVYFNNVMNDKIEIYNLQGKKIDEIEIYGGNCSFGDSKYLFVENMPDKDGEFSEKYGLYVFDKSKIGSKEKEWKGIECYKD